MLFLLNYASHRARLDLCFIISNFLYSFILENSLQVKDFELEFYNTGLFNLGN